MALGQDVERCNSELAVALPLGSPENQTIQAEDRFTYEPPHRKPYPFLIGILRRYLFRLYCVLVLVGTGVYLSVDYGVEVKKYDGSGLPPQFIIHCKNFSIPLVCLAFTWFHVWLALKMVFYPIKFYGCGRPIVPKWLGLPINGWQGIVPFRIEKMATRAVDAMIGNIVTVDEFMDRVKPDHFYEQLEDMMTGIATEVMERIVMKRWPIVWDALPASAKLELREQVLEETRRSFSPALADLKSNINSIVDMKQMSIDVLVGNPKLMVDMFLEIAPRELSFIQHVAAVMGFVLGLVQMVICMNVTGKYTDYWLLPVSGLILGFFTNWLALKMTFAPIWPHMMCGDYVNVQGVFLKRQKEAAEKMSEVIVKHVVQARAMLKYIVNSSPGGVDKLLDIYQRHLQNTINQSLGAARGMMPSFVTEGIDDMKQDVIDISLELLPKHTEAIERYMDETMKVQETLGWRLSRLQPPEFEAIVHPIFTDDEWILLLVGAVLGVAIGVLQAWAYQVITVPE